MKNSILKIINFSKKSIIYKTISICYSNEEDFYLNDLMIKIIKEFEIKYNFDIVNFNISRNISAKINDITSVRKNKILIKLTEDKNDLLLQKTFEQSLIKIIIYDIKNNKNSLIIVSNNEHKNIKQTTFTDFCRKIITNEPLSDYIFLKKKDILQVIEIIKNSQNYLAIKILESINRDFLNKNNNIKIITKIKETINNKINEKFNSNIIFTFQILHKNFLTLIFLLKNITNILQNNSEYQKVMNVFKVLVLENNSDFFKELNSNDDKKFLSKIRDKIQNKIVKYERVNFLKYNKFLEKIKNDNFYQKNEINKNAIELLIIPEKELQVEFLVKKFKDFIKDYNLKLNPIQNEMHYNWRLFQVKFEELEIYPAIFFWESYFQKFTLFFQKENEDILDFIKCKDFINSIIDFIKDKNIFIEYIKFTNIEEF